MEKYSTNAEFIKTTSKAGASLNLHYSKFKGVGQTIGKSATKINLQNRRS